MSEPSEILRTMEDARIDALAAILLAIWTLQEQIDQRRREDAQIKELEKML